MTIFIQIEYTNGKVNTLEIEEEAQVKDFVNTIWWLNEGATLDMNLVHNVAVIRKNSQEEIAKREEEAVTEKEIVSQKVKINHTFKIERNTNHNKDIINVYDQDGNRLSTDVADQFAWRNTHLSKFNDEIIQPYTIEVTRSGSWDIYRDVYNKEFVDGGHTLEELCKYLNENNYYFRYTYEDGE